ncbi:glyoxalase superfamily protein [Sphingomonas sp. Leaf21]|jgi:catechol 2,3-dioxygenase-like lactoylglutathione lyase family enzyme|uniref:glyoxalase superfamily protein n=1 Tax=Sphingomonas sp. Leaf21 TaxID=2876550 RepID=UPI001E618975|nr:glyoxalase superfamily protein [Sphingomonas sp. Leaf21]
MTRGYDAPIPILRSFDAEHARAFYFDFLGFELVFEHRFEPDMPLYMGIARGACVLHLSEHYGDATPGSAVRIPVDDVHAFVAELNAKGHGHARPGKPRSMPWGMDEIALTDPAGNRLIFYTERDDETEQ